MLQGRMKDLLKLAESPRRTIVGLMSGTSVDGIDAAVVDIEGCGFDTKVKLRSFHTMPYSQELENRILEAFEGSAEELCELNFLLGEAFAEASLQAMQAAGLKPSEVDAIASPGQTIFHVDRRAEGVSSTLELGESAVIAERCGCIVVSDFRTRDIAAGGSGAPLVPYVDNILFAKAAKRCALQNIGGISNLTVPGFGEQALIAFDTGPGNVIINEIVKELQDDDYAYDKDGRFSSLGKVDEPLLAELMTHPYLRLAPPKSTGRELFGVEFCRGLVEDYDPYAMIDLLATVVAFTARSIHDAYERFVLPHCKLERVIVSGGGAHNRTLMRFLKDGLGTRDIEVLRWDEVPGLGFSGDAKEAVAFAILANETLSGRCSNVPAATGADHPVIQGKITL